MRDLIGLDLGLSERFGFPEDPPASGFDNIGKALVMSPLQMELYYDAAKFVIDRALVEGDRPKSIKWRVQFENGVNGMDRYREEFDGQNLIVNAGKNPIVDGMVKIHHDAWNKVPGFRRFKVPYEGHYTVRVRAAGEVPSQDEVFRTAEAMYAKRKGQNWTEKHIEHFRDDRRYHYGAPRMRLKSSFSNSQPVIWGDVDVDAPISSPEIYTFQTYFDADGAGLQINNVYTIPRHLYNFWCKSSEEFMDPKKHSHTFPRPTLYVDWLEIEGPVLNEWPPESHSRILFESPEAELGEGAYARAVIASFMQRAFRRPVSDEEVDKKLEIFRRVRPEKSSFVEAIKSPLIAVMVSPSFLFISEPSDQEQGRELDSHEKVARLSYFLWSTMPDGELAKLAATGPLGAEQLASQVDRMLANPKSQSFVENFAGQWLGLREIGNNPPGMEYFPRYDRHLETSMQLESEAFFAEVLHKDLPVQNFLKSDWSMLNQRLARFYDIDGVKGDQFQRVSLPAGSQRGGVVTQGSMLTVTSNGTRTSPVVRGKWILERLLGDPPPPPPPNVEEIPQPNVNAALPIRDRLDQHR
ncbi:MAG: DUF1592 domain-containing protein, partial [Verrucomicrobiota bacterium]